MTTCVAYGEGQGLTQGPPADPNPKVRTRGMGQLVLTLAVRKRNQHVR